MFGVRAITKLINIYVLLLFFLEMAEVTPRLFMADIVEIEFLVQYHLLVINYFFSFARMNHVQLQVLKFFGTERHKVIKDVMSRSSVIF